MSLSINKTVIVGDILVEGETKGEYVIGIEEFRDYSKPYKWF